jgi:hypothetical protein
LFMFFDPNPYIFMEGNLVLLLVIYVDDVDDYIEPYYQHYLVMELCKSFDMIIMGCLALYMGIQYVYMHVGISMGYECYICKCFCNLSLVDWFNVSTSMDPSTKLTMNMATPLIDAAYYYIFKICKSHHCFLLCSHFTSYEVSS